MPETTRLWPHPPPMLEADAVSQAWDAMRNSGWLAHLPVELHRINEEPTDWGRTLHGREAAAYWAATFAVSLCADDDELEARRVRLRPGLLGYEVREAGSADGNNPFAGVRGLFLPCVLPGDLAPTLLTPAQAMRVHARGVYMRNVHPYVWVALAELEEYPIRGFNPAEWESILGLSRDRMAAVERHLADIRKGSPDSADVPAFYILLASWAVFAAGAEASEAMDAGDVEFISELASGME